MTTMRKILFTVMIIGLTASATYAQSAKEAIMALKKMEARTQSGISYRDYSSALGEAKFAVNMFQESKDASKDIELKESILRVMGHYEMAGTFWGYKFSIWEHGISGKGKKIVIAIYPDASKDADSGGAVIDIGGGSKIMIVERLLPIIWSEASNELTIATKLYSKLDDDTACDCDKLISENKELKKQVKLLESKIKKYRKR